MDMYQSLLSTNSILNEQIARHIFEVLPENGPIIIIIDKNGNIWPSDSGQFTKLSLNESFLKDICARIDDGAEPLMTNNNDCSIIGIQLVTEKLNYGYILIALPKYSPESTLVNIDLIEILLSQFNLIARLIEKNNHLYEIQMKQYGLCGQESVTMN